MDWFCRDNIHLIEVCLEYCKKLKMPFSRTQTTFFSLLHDRTNYRKFIRVLRGRQYNVHAFFNRSEFWGIFGSKKTPLFSPAYGSLSRKNVSSSWQKNIIPKFLRKIWRNEIITIRSVTKNCHYFWYKIKIFQSIFIDVLYSAW